MILPLPSPNRVLKLCLSNLLAKMTILSSDGASFCLKSIRYRDIEIRVDSASPSPKRVLIHCISNRLAKMTILSSDGASLCL